MNELSAIYNLCKKCVGNLKNYAKYTKNNEQGNTA